MQCAGVEIEDVRFEVNADFTEKLADSERFGEGCFWKQRRNFEKKWRDPDDVYIEVQRREEERRKERLPGRLSVLPRSAVAEEAQRQGLHLRKKKRAKRKATSNAKDSAGVGS